MVSVPKPSGPVRVALVAALALVLVLAGFILGWRVAPQSTVESEIGRVSFAVSPSVVGDATGVIPVADWGFRADAFDAPFELRAELRSLDRAALIQAADGEFSVIKGTEDDLKSGAQSAVLRAFAWGAGGAIALLVIATLVARAMQPRWLLLAIGGALTAVLAGGSLFAARATFDESAFEQPTYFANGAELGRILEVIENERLQSGYGSEFGSILRGISTVLASAPGSASPTRDFFVGSDLHANALVIDPLAETIGDDPLLLAGDYGQRGGAAEARLLAPRVAALGSRVIATSGNHDTSGLMEALTRQGVRVLGQGDPSRPATVEIDGLVIAGFPDPLEWSGRGDPDSRPITFADLPDPVAALDEARQDVIDGFDSLATPPDIVMIHQNGLAQSLADELFERGYERDLVIVTGHDHQQHVDRYGSILVVDGGSIGAGGIFDAGNEAIGLAELHFLPSTPDLRSIDLISIEPFSGQAQASRVVVDSLCPDSERCSFDPPGFGSSVLSEPEEEEESG